MRRGIAAAAVAALAALALAAAAGGCGGSGDGGGPPVVTDRTLGDSLALAANQRFEELGLFGTRVGDDGGSCRGGGARWRCTLEVALEPGITDDRTYYVRVTPRGCWIARQIGTDVGERGRPARPRRPDVLRGCLEE